MPKSCTLCHVAERSNGVTDLRQHGERRSRVGGHSTASVSLGIAEHFGADLFMNEALDQPPDNALRFTMPHSNPKVASTGTEATAVAAPLPIRLLSDMSAATVGGDGSSQSVPFERSCSFAPAQSSMLKRSAVARRHEPAWGPLIKARNGPHAPSGRTVRSVMQAFPVLTSQADRYSTRHGQHRRQRQPRTSTASRTSTCRRFLATVLHRHYVYL